MNHLVVASQNGGTGRTTLSVNLSYALASRGRRVILIDADPLGGAGFSLSTKASTAQGFYDMALDRDIDRVRVESLLLGTRLPEFKFLPAGHVAQQPAIMDRLDQEPDLQDRFRAIFTAASDTSLGPDVVIVDTPAGVRGLPYRLMRSGSHLLLPQLAHPLGLRTLPVMLRALAQLRTGQGKEAPMIAGVVLTMVEPGVPVSLEVQREFRELLPGHMFFDAQIPRDREFLQASQAGVPIALLQRHPSATAFIFDQLAAELESRLALNNPGHENEFTRLMD